MTRVSDKALSVSVSGKLRVNMRETSGKRMQSFKSERVKISNNKEKCIRSSSNTRQE